MKNDCKIIVDMQGGRINALTYEHFPPTFVYMSNETGINIRCGKEDPKDFLNKLRNFAEIALEAADKFEELLISGELQKILKKKD